MLVFLADLPMFCFCSSFLVNLQNHCHQKISIFLQEMSVVKKIINMVKNIDSQGDMSSNTTSNSRLENQESHCNN